VVDTLGRVIPQGMQREDGSTDRKALVVRNQVREKKKLAKEVVTAKNSSGER